MQRLAAALGTVDFARLFSAGDVDEVCTKFVDTISQLANITCPKSRKIKRRTSAQKPWVTDEIKNKGKALKDLFWFTRQINSADAFEHYKVKKREHKLLIDRTKRMYYSKQINQSDNKTRQVWHIINENVGNEKGKFCNALELDGVEITEVDAIVNAFAEYFSKSVTTKLKQHYPGTRPIPGTCSGSNSASFSSLP